MRALATPRVGMSRDEHNDPHHLDYNDQFEAVDAPSASTNLNDRSLNTPHNIRTAFGLDIGESHNPPGGGISDLSTAVRVYRV